MQAYLLERAETAQAMYEKKQKKPSFVGGEAFSQKALAMVGAFPVPLAENASPLSHFHPFLPPPFTLPAPGWCLP